MAVIKNKQGIYIIDSIPMCYANWSGGNTYPSFGEVTSSDFLVDMSDYPTGAKARLLICWGIGNSSFDSTELNTETLYMQMYQRSDDSLISGSQASQLWNNEANWSWKLTTGAAFSLPTGYQSFYLKLAFTTLRSGFLPKLSTVSLQIIMEV
jgi:hypothetical protein